MEAETLPATDSQLDHLLGNGTPSDDRTTPAPASPDSTLPSSASQYEDDVTSLELKRPYTADIIHILYLMIAWCTKHAVTELIFNKGSCSLCYDMFPGFSSILHYSSVSSLSLAQGAEASGA